MKHEDKNHIFKSCCDLVDNIAALNMDLIDQNTGLTPMAAIKSSATFFRSKISEYSSRYLRNQKLVDNDLYVPPEERAIGTRIEMVYNKEECLEIPTMIQSSLQYVPILSSLKIFFADKENRDLYLTYQREHHCVEGIYERFCCGQLYQSSEFYQTNFNAIQIQLAIDDFEPCNPLGSKSSLHKICGLYFVINNMPLGFTSKLQNINLISLSNSDDLDTNHTDINNIWEMVVDEIRFLENTGIDIGGGIRLKGTLQNLTADNLGANTSLCLTRGFRSYNFCRICKNTKGECESMVVDDLSKYRTIEHYEDILKLLDAPDLAKNKSKTFGIKKYCVLNELKYFHIFKNFSVDIMHDLYEGVISCLLNHVFSSCIVNKLFKEKELREFVQYYVYPKKFRRDKPSNLRLDKSNLGQNATQMKCLFFNVPFILFKFRSDPQLNIIWECVTSLIRIVQIVHATVVNETMLENLTSAIIAHLESMKNIFGLNYTPKHHFMVHYPNIIRLMGPIYLMSMIRYEAKHKVFKAIVKKTNNFININKTLATVHQQNACIKGNAYDEISYSKQKMIMVTDIKRKYGEIPDLNNILDRECFEITWMYLNIYRYDRDTVILHNHNLYAIEKLLVQAPQIYFVCSQLKSIGLDEYSCSIEIYNEIPEEYRLIRFNDLCHRKPYSMKCIENRKFIIVDNYDIINAIMC